MAATGKISVKGLVVVLSAIYFAVGSDRFGRGKRCKPSRTLEAADGVFSADVGWTKGFGFAFK